MERRFRSHVVFSVAVVVTILHFISMSIARHYIAIQIGSGTGVVVAKGLIEATEAPNASEDTQRGIYQSMKDRSDDVISRWRIPLQLTSLPMRPVIDPVLNNIRRSWISEPVVAKRISKEQFRQRMMVIEGIGSGLNSLTLGVIVYVAMKVFRSGRGKRK